MNNVHNCHSVAYWCTWKDGPVDWECRYERWFPSGIILHFNESTWIVPGTIKNEELI